MLLLLLLPLLARATVPLSTIPDDVAVGALGLGSVRLLYTYVNSTTLFSSLALVFGGVIGIAVFLFLYDLAVNGDTARDDNINEANFDYLDPYGYSNSFDATTRIRKR